jgi:hypothetical protein
MLKIFPLILSERVTKNIEEGRGFRIMGRISNNRGGSRLNLLALTLFGKQL